MIVTWQAGGGNQVAIGLGRLLAARGHRVRIFAPASDGARVRAAGCTHHPLPAALELDAKLRRAEDQRDVLERIFFGREVVDAVQDELANAPCDVIVVDYLMRSLAGAAEQLPAANVLLIHTIFGFHGRVEDEATLQRWYAPVNAARAKSGLDQLPVGPDSVTVSLVHRSAGAIVAVPREFDDWRDPPGHVVHVGPISEALSAAGWEPPWPPDDARPLVVVSLGSQYMQQEDALARIAAALDGLPVRGLVLTGRELDPSDVPGAPNVLIAGYLPHESVLPHASLVVTHGGTGTLLAAFGAGCPVVCMPLGRDQPANARRVEELGLGQVVSTASPPPEIAAAISSVLGSNPHRDAAARMAEVLARYGRGEAAVRMLEALADQRQDAA